ncbi:replication-relaxation family protein [Micromonospora sp. NPDC005172]|uniref:replication-relaxation family protein n=1 Tax=Micromonospora sp. NPDC005172 TaxID=3156867 RepID=UPI0033B01A45
MREHRMTWAAVERLAESLSERDRAILRDVARVRVLTGAQLTRLHFTNLDPTHRDRSRRRVLARLVSLQLLTTLGRRIGGARAGSAGLVFALTAAGQRLGYLLAEDRVHAPRVRQPQTPTERFLSHSLAISELFVALTELMEAGRLALADYRAEPASWWSDGLGGWIKPDAYVVVRFGDVQDAYAVEVDRATESLPTLRRKLATYLDLVDRGDRGPDDSDMPRVLLTVPDDRRRADVAALLRALPPPADQLFMVVRQEQAPEELARSLRE